MRIRSILNKKGVTLIELLVALVIAAITMAGIYRVFISQTKTYAIQGEVMEVQQSVRGTMEILLRDLRMTGFDDDTEASRTAGITIPNPLATPVQTSDITISYEYYDRTLNQYQKHDVRYWRDGGTSRLMRRLTVTTVAGTVAGSPEMILENVDALTFTYGVDRDNDGIMDDSNNDGVITFATFPTGDLLQAGSVGTQKVVAITVSLTGRPDETNTDVSKAVSPRTLVSAVTLRNLSLR
jgi:type IV pilus assembly protein PilW